MNQINNQPPKGRVRVYACGGAAINIVKDLRNTQVSPELMADIEVSMVDTSAANLLDYKSTNDTYLIPELDGSGKVRSENSTVIRQSILDILQQHKPADLNIVLSSAGGGSGSVIAPMLVSELLERQAPVIVLTVGTTSSRIEIENTLKTLSSFDAIAKKREAPVVMHYLQNSATLPPKDVNLQMVTTIVYLGILFSRRNRRLDSMDLYNWLRFSKKGVTTFGPQLALLTVLWHNENDASVNKDMSQLGNVISVATLAPELANTDLAMPPEYQTVGILPEPSGDKDASILNGKVLNYVISDGRLKEITKSLDKQLKDLDAAASARQQAPAIVTIGKADDDGMVY